MRIEFIHSHIEELAESLIQDLNHNNKYNVKKSHFPFINNGIILKIIPSFSLTIIRVRRILDTRLK